MCFKKQQAIGNRQWAAGERRKIRKPHGFSLLEVMVVLVILGLLVGIVAVKNVRSYLIKAKQKTARIQITEFMQHLEAYRTEASQFPPADKWVAALTEPSEYFPEPPMKSIPLDPWGKDYQYVYLGPQDVEIICLGEDGQPDGTGANADISSKDLEKKQE
jgi:general secretion pathway protein G